MKPPGKPPKYRMQLAAHNEAQRFYFVHSFRAVCDEPADVLATVDYAGTTIAAFSRGNIFGCQFHPEKSHRYGMDLLRRFMEIPA